jgi:hypothetical protein
MTHQTMAASISGMFRQMGAKPLSVRTNPRGYVAKFATRDEALSAAIAILSAFRADLEAGFVDVGTMASSDGGALLCVNCVR